MQCKKEIRSNRKFGSYEKPERLVNVLSAFVKGILQLFTNFNLHRKVMIFLRNDRYCKAVDQYNTRKRYTVIESLDLMKKIL
jgi:hypothetical protein